MRGIPKADAAKYLAMASEVGPTSALPSEARKPQATKIDPVVWRAFGIPIPTPEFRFCERRWRFDYAWEQKKVALEIDGGAHTQGRHTRGKGFVADQAKRNRATVLGWRVLHCTPADVKSGAIFKTIREALG